jgi:hypothetical protein
MIRVAFHRLRVEPLEERWLPAASVAPVRPPISQTGSAASTQAEATNNASEYENGADGDEHYATTSAGESPSEYKSSRNQLSNARFENPYFFNNRYYAVVAIPPPPAPAVPAKGTVDASATEPRIVSRPPDQVSSPVSDDQPAVPISAPSESHPLPSIPEPAPEMPPDPPPVDEQEVPTTPPTEESMPQPGATPAELLDDLTVRLRAGELEQAARRLLDGLDRVIANVTDLDSPWVRLGYWIGTAAAVGVAIELTRHGLRTRRPRLDLRTSARLPVN